MKPTSKSASDMLLETGEYSDLAIICDGHTFRVHQKIVGARSAVIAAQLRGPWKEAKTGIICVEEFDAGTIARLLAYIYKEEHIWKDDDKDPPGHDSYAYFSRWILNNMRLAVAADYYAVDGVGAKAVAKAKAYLTESCWRKEGFDEVVRLLYSSVLAGDSALRQATCRLAFANRAHLLNDNGFTAATGCLPQFFTDMLEVQFTSHQDSIDVQQKSHEAEVLRDRAAWRIEKEQLEHKISSLRTEGSGLEMKVGQQKSFIASMQVQIKKCQAETLTASKKFEKASRDLMAIQAPGRLVVRCVGDLEADLGDENIRKQLIRLMCLYEGCCGDDKGSAEAKRNGNGPWTFICRHCRKTFTVKSPSGRVFEEKP